jgi:hypothetical protein
MSTEHRNCLILAFLTPQPLGWVLVEQRVRALRRRRNEVSDSNSTNTV